MSRISAIPEDFEDAYGLLADGGEAVGRLAGNEHLLPDLRLKDFLAEFYAGSEVEDDPEFVPLVVVLAREDAARVDGYDLHGTGQVVRVLLKAAPGFIDLERRRPVLHEHLLQSL